MDQVILGIVIVTLVLGVAGLNYWYWLLPPEEREHDPSDFWW